MAKGPKIAPITAQYTGLRFRLFAITWQKTTHASARIRTTTAAVIIILIRFDVTAKGVLQSEQVNLNCFHHRLAIPPVKYEIYYLACIYLGICLIVR